MIFSAITDYGNNYGAAVQMPLAPAPVVATDVGEAVPGTSAQALVQAASETAADPNATCRCEACVKGK